MRFVNKKYLVIVITMLVVIEISCVHLMYQSSRNKETILDNVKLVEENNIPEMFAIMLEQSDGTYAESDSSDWPSSDVYVYNPVMSGCIDINGNKLDGILTYNSSTNVASVETGNTSYCYLYFSEPINLYELCENTNNMEDCLNIRGKQVSMVNNVTDEITGGMYRYQGTKDKVTDNYICFGTSDTSECLSNTDKYLYRILGFDSNGYLKLIKNSHLSTTYPWHSGHVEAWNVSTLYTGLNDSYFLNAVDTNNEKLYVPTDWEDKIVVWNWKYGSISSKEYFQSGVNVYVHEDSWTDYVTNKVGLMYIHDYYLGISNSTYCSNGSTNCVNSWLSSDTHEWLMSYWPLDTNGVTSQAWTIKANNSVYGTWVGSSLSARPVFYLENAIKIAGGKGTLENPFIIE